MTNASEFQAKIRIMNCLDGRDFKAIFGESDWEHYADKFWNVYKRDIAKFIMYLDNNNVQTYMNFVEAIHEEHKIKYA